MRESPVNKQDLSPKHSQIKHFVLLVGMQTGPATVESSMQIA